MVTVRTSLTVNQLLRRKGGGAYATYPGATVYEALLHMAEKNVGALLVIEGGKLVGIFSERDYARKVILQGKTSHVTQVREIMTDKVFFVRPEDTIEECMALMTAQHIRHLPVLSNDEVVGVISIGDVVKAVIDEQGFVIEQMANYITGER